MGTSLSPQTGTHGPSQGQGAFTPLSQLTVGCRSWIRVRVRVSRIWVASNPINGEVYGIHCLLIDSEGVVMQACARPLDMERLKQQLVEGRVYALSNFGVRQKLDKYMACSNGFVISMGAQTMVNEITNHAGSWIPLHSFEFVDFGDLSSRNNDRSLLTDVIGQIVSIEDEGQTWKWDGLRNISFRNIHLRDLSGTQLNVALYGDLGRNFVAELVFKQDQKGPVVAIFAGMLVEYYKEIGFIVRSTSASKYYLDLDVEEVQKFRASLDGPHKSIDCLPCRLQKPVNQTELVDSWRTIEQLRSPNAYELQRTWLCRATLKGIDCSKGWSYQSCFHCRCSISCDGSKFSCIKGCPNNMLPVERYKLHAVMEDETGSTNVMIFDDAAQKLVGVAAEELGEDTDDDISAVGEVTGDDISAVISSQHKRAFVVTCGSGCFVLKHVLNDDELQRLNSGFHIEAGDHSDLSQDVGSYASDGSRSQVKKVKMVIKEEIDAADGGEEPEVDSSSASCSPSPLKNFKKEDMATEEEREPKRQKTANGNGLADRFRMSPLSSQLIISEE